MNEDWKVMKEGGRQSIYWDIIDIPSEHYVSPSWSASAELDWYSLEGLGFESQEVEANLKHQQTGSHENDVDLEGEAERSASFNKGEEEENFVAGLSLSDQTVDEVRPKPTPYPASMPPLVTPELSSEKCLTIFDSHWLLAWLEGAAPSVENATYSELLKTEKVMTAVPDGKYEPEVVIIPKNAVTDSKKAPSEMATWREDKRMVVTSLKVLGKHKEVQRAFRQKQSRNLVITREAYELDANQSLEQWIYGPPKLSLPKQQWQELLGYVPTGQDKTYGSSRRHVRQANLELFWDDDKEKRLGWLCAHLKADRVLSLGQVLRRYGLNKLDLENAPFHVFTISVSLTRHATNENAICCVTLDERVTKLDANQIRHLCGTAEMRYLLRAKGEHWTSSAEARQALLRPDAIWKTPNGEVAIEFDAGSYSKDQIEQKTQAFSTDFAAQIWGSPSKHRVAHLTTFLRDVGESQLPLLIC